jgi:hypothetical protein
VEDHSQSIRGIDKLFRRLSFGFSGGKTPDTSTAVAYGLILNYLDRTFDSNILPDILKAEPLQGSTWDQRRYPQTALLHNCLLRRCHLEPSPVGRWGKNVAERLKRFWRTDPWQLGVIVRGTFGGYGSGKAWELIKREVDLDLPVMVTTTYERLKDKKELYHTMVACGYRVDTQGRREILVHPGKYGEHVKGSRAQLCYISVKHVICSYSFEVGLLPSAMSESLH